MAPRIRKQSVGTPRRSDPSGKQYDSSRTYLSRII